jgi:hypothetical protein
MHLTPEVLIDLAEGTREPSSTPHLAACELCRAQLVELRDAMATLAVDVPEPSPLFWDHLSSRVRQAVAAESSSRASWFGAGRWYWGFAAVSAAAVVLAASLTLRTAPTPVSPVPQTVADVSAGDAASADDASFSLIRDLAGGLDGDSAAEAGIDADVGAADGALTELNDTERTELRRLLREDMTHAGA